MYNNYLEKFAENNISLLPNDWESYINKQFGLTWTLHDFQLSALKNALVVLSINFIITNVFPLPVAIQKHICLKKSEFIPEIVFNKSKSL